MGFGLKISKEKYLDQFKTFLNRLTPIPEEEWNYYRKFLELINLKKGQVYCQQGEFFNKSTYVCSGLLQATHIDEINDHEIIKRFYITDMKMGPYREMLERKASEMTIKALEDCCLISNSVNLVEELRRRDKCWEVISRKLMELELIYNEKKSQILMMRSPEERYNLFLRDHPELSNRISNRKIAQYLGISDVSLSRIRSRLKKR